MARWDNARGHRVTLPIICQSSVKQSQTDKKSGQINCWLSLHIALTSCTIVVGYHIPLV